MANVQTLARLAAGLWAALSLALIVSIAAPFGTGNGQAAEVICDSPDPVTGGCVILSTSATERLQFNDAVVTTQSDVGYSTQIIGRLSGGTALYDQLFALPYLDPAVQLGLDQARMAITTAGGPGIIIVGPVLTASSTTTTSAGVTVYTLAGTVTTVADAADVVFGPATVTAGDLNECDVSSLPSTTMPTCVDLPGVVMDLNSNQTSANVAIDVVHTIDQATTITNTTTVFEQYTLTGVVQAVGGVHGAVQSGALDAGGRFLRRLGQAAAVEGEPMILQPLPGVAVLSEVDAGIAALPVATWAEAYGTAASSEGDDVTPGSERRSAGLAAGASVGLSDDVTLAFGLDHGSTSVELDEAFAESATIALTQLGVAAGLSSGPWVGTLAATAGFGAVETLHEVGGRASATYGLETFGVLAQLGYAFELEGTQITPGVGVDYAVAHTDGFRESGGLALVAREHTSDRVRAWIGVDVARSSGALDLTGHLRLVGTVAGSEGELPVAYAGISGAPMTISGAGANGIGLEFGGKLEYGIGSGASLFAGYDGQFRDGATVHAGRIGLRVEF